MARTWTFYATVSPGSSFNRHTRVIQTNDEDLVYIGPDNSGDFYSYNGTTLTSIGFETWANAQGGDWDSSSGHGVGAAWYNSNLYIVANKNAFSGDDASVVQFAPGGSTFTDVKDFGALSYAVAPGGVSFIGKYAAADSTKIIVRINDNPGGGNEGQFWQSTDGTTWTETSDIDPIVSNGTYIVYGEDSEIRRDILASSATASTSTRVWEDDSGWTDLTGSDLTTTYLLGYCQGKSWFTELDTGVYEVVQSDDWGATTSAGTGSVSPITANGNLWKMYDVAENAQILGYTDSNLIFEYELSSGLFESSQALEYPGSTPNPYVSAFYLGSTIYILTSSGIVWTGGAIGKPELRYTGIAADDATIYVTGNEGGALKVWAFDINSLNLIRSLPLGAATYAQLDSRTYGVYPVVKPGENKLFIRGRDGNDVHVQYSDDYAVSLTDVDDGGWGAAKYAVALLHDPLVPDDVIVAFSDDDIYRSEDDAGTWAKVDDAAVTLREVARNTIDELQLMLAGQSAGAGQLFFSPNLGVTSEDVSDAGIDIINHIEPSL